MIAKQKPYWKRFRELTLADINVEFHLHTNWTDGEASIAAIMERSVAVGLCQIAFTEHVRHTTDWYAKFANAVSHAAKDFPSVQVFLGCEAKALDTFGTLDVNPAILEECDLVLGSVHRFPDGCGGFLDFRTLQSEQFAQIEFELACGLIDHAPIDVLAHPGGMYFRRFGTDLPEPLMRSLIQRCNAKGISIEINSAYLKDVEGYLRLCTELNPLVSIGSDAHQLDKLGHCRDLLIAKGIGNL